MPPLSANLHRLLELAVGPGIFLLLLALLLLDATAPRFRRPALNSSQARRAWALYAALVLLAALIIGVWWWIDRT